MFSCSLNDTLLFARIMIILCFLNVILLVLFLKSLFLNSIYVHNCFYETFNESYNDILSGCKSVGILTTSLQGFIQAILMSSRQHKKLNLLTEFSNLISQNFSLKHTGSEIACKIN